MATAIAERDFGPAAVHVSRAWRLFSEGIRHHPALHYYIGPYFIGPGGPLVLDPEHLQARLDPAFFGVFYWHWETSSTRDAEFLIKKQPLFFAHPGFKIWARRGPNREREVGLEELQTMAALWEKGARELELAKRLVPPAQRLRFRQEYILGQHLACTWRSAAHVEEFLRLRDTVRQFSRSFSVRAGHVKENLRDLERMTAIARAELEITRRDLALVKDADFLDLSLRLDMATASQADILRAKIKHTQHLLTKELPAWRKMLLTW